MQKYIAFIMMNYAKKMVLGFVLHVDVGSELRQIILPASAKENFSFFKPSQDRKYKSKSVR